MCQWVSKDHVRDLFSSAMSDMYRQEVPQYGSLLDLVEQVNREVLESDHELAAELLASGELSRINVERHGAIRVGTPSELATLRRLFAVMGMYPVGYYDLSVAGVPVHSTAFRPVDDEALKRNPFRVFTSLLRLELINNIDLRRRAESILSARDIFTPGVLGLIELAETQGGLNEAQAKCFVIEALETFRWHNMATVDLATYRELSEEHRLIADVVCFQGPHINHLTPRTLDIDEVQRRMPEVGIDPKAVIEGPPRRACPILLRQTSFKALQEPIAFTGNERGEHTARFGEIEQRGIALTRRGRQIYDSLLNSSRENGAATNNEAHQAKLAEVFREFPDNHTVMRREGLAFYCYRAVPERVMGADTSDIEALISCGALIATPMVYEDFLPVSAAGIFQSNLGGCAYDEYQNQSRQSQFEKALGVSVIDEIELYQLHQEASLESALSKLKS